MTPYPSQGQRKNPLFWHLPGEYPGKVNPGSIWAPFILFDDVFCHLPAKNDTLLHTFFKYAISIGIMVNGAISFEI
jgi:hypothetical protein